MNPNTPYVTHLAVAKFSHTTTLIEHAGPLTWHHVNGNGDLLCIFEKLPGSLSVPARLILRVVQPQGILEQIDLVHAMTSTQDLNGSPQKMLFTVIVKMPCLAIKYPSGPTYLRRFQIKFVSDRDYYTALALLGEINCPLAEGSAPSVPSSRRLPSTMSLNSEYAPSLARSYTGEPHTSSAIPFHSAAYRSATATTTNPPLSCSGSVSHVTSYQAHPPARSIGPGNARAQATFRRSQDTRGFDHEPMRRTNTYALPSTAVPYHDIEPLNQMLPPRSEQARRTSTTTIATRPAISAAHHDIASLSHDLPPKRTLPFSNQKPSAKKTRTNAAPQTQTPSSTPCPQLPHPCAELNEAQVSHENVPLQGLSRCASNIQVFQSQPPSPTPTQRHPQRLPTQRLHLNPPKPPPISRPNTSTQRSTDLDGHTLSATQPHPDIPPNTTTSITQSETQNQNQHQNPGSQPPAQHPSSSSSSIEQTLSQYSSAPTSERTAMLENWMCELLEDDKFMTLCEDVEGVWRRFAFGKKT